MNFVKRHSKVFMILPLFIMILASWIYLGNLKIGMYEDEMITYFLSNAEFGLDPRNNIENIHDAEYAKQDLINILGVTSNTKFNFKNVVENYDEDVHPPLYGFLVNIVHSFFPYKFSKWMGLTLNLILYLITVFLVFITANKLFKNQLVSIIATYIYGMSLSGLSAMLYIRMYILLTLLTILLAYEILCFIENKKVCMYPIIGSTIFLGLMTQYSYVYYAFFLCLAVLVYLIIEKEYKRAIWFSVSAIGGVILMLLLWMPFFKDISGGQVSSGGTLLENTKNIANWFPRISIFYQLILFGTILTVPTALAAGVLAIFKIRKLSELKNYKSTWVKLMILLIPFYATFLIVAISSPALFEQYAYHISVFHIFTLSIVIYVFEIFYKGKYTVLKNIAVILVILATIPLFLHYKAHWLFQDQAVYSEVFSDYSDSPCLVIDSAFENEYIQLMSFDDIFITGDIISEKGKTYIENHDNNEKLVVFYRKDAPIYKNSFSKGEEICNVIELKTGYVYEKTLFDNIGGGAEVYLFTK